VPEPEAVPEPGRAPEAEAASAPRPAVPAPPAPAPEGASAPPLALELATPPVPSAGGIWARFPRVPKLPERRGPARRLREALRLTLVGLVAFAVGLEIFNSIVMPRLIHGTAEVRVPDLSNLTLAQATRALEGVQLRIGTAGERFDPVAPRGSVLSQDPLPDTPVRIRRRVMVVVSMGVEFAAVPDMAGLSVRGARLALDRVGLGFTGTTRASSEDIGVDMVVDSDPPAGTVLSHGASVGLLLSSGPADEEFVMPDLLGRDLAAVRARLEGLGFKVEIPSRSAHGPVVFQNPAVGSRVSRGATVFLQAARSRR